MYAIYAYIDPQNHPYVGIYGSPMGRVWVTIHRDVNRPNHV